MTRAQDRANPPLARVLDLGSRRDAGDWLPGQRREFARRCCRAALPPDTQGSDRSGPVGAPLDRCLRLAMLLPVPDEVSARDRDILFAVIGRFATDRSMAAIGADFGLSAAAVQRVARRVMRAQGIRGVAWSDAGYDQPYACCDLPRPARPAR